MAIGRQHEAAAMQWSTPIHPSDDHPLVFSKRPLLPTPALAPPRSPLSDDHSDSAHPFSVRTPSLCRSDTSASVASEANANTNTNANANANHVSGAAPAIAAALPSSPPQPNVSLLSAALLADNTSPPRIPNVNGGCWSILRREGGGQLASGGPKSPTASTPFADATAGPSR